MHENLGSRKWKRILRRIEVLDAALRILSDAKVVALYRIIDEAALGEGRTYRALETWRWVANAYNHVERAQREAHGLDRRGDPCLPSW